MDISPFVQALLRHQRDATPTVPGPALTPEQAANIHRTIRKYFTPMGPIPDAQDDLRRKIDELPSDLQAIARMWLLDDQDKPR